jgi:hypothetical protein
MSESSEIMQFRVTIATNCQPLTRYMNVNLCGTSRTREQFVPLHCVYTVE